MQKVDVVIIGAGAAGLFCASEAGKRQRRVLVLDHANKAGKKILMSGGGRCNFTNYHMPAECFLSHNPHFCKSALSRYTPWDFIELVKKHRIPFHEKTAGQLFCDHKAQDIVNMLLQECTHAKVELRLQTAMQHISQLDNGDFKISSTNGEWCCESLVIATGGLSIPTMGASPLGYQLAAQFGINVWPTRAGLVPLTLHTDDLAKFAALSGVSVASEIYHTQQSFTGNLLFTHRGLSGPAILQISSYWHPGTPLTVHMLPGIDLAVELKLWQQQQPQKSLKTALLSYLPKRLLEIFFSATILEEKLGTLSTRTLETIKAKIQHWQILPNGTEGYRTAEVTLGGVDCAALSSKTMAVEHVPGLYFVGEVLDVTGWLGGYNFQWAWSSGWAAGQVV